MRDQRRSDALLKKIEWIAKLSNETYPGGLPGDVEGLRTLLNRIVLDVRAACAQLERGQASDPSDKSDRSDNSDERKKSDLIPTHGGYRNLRSFQTAQIVYDGTVIFCDRFVSRRSRTHDQMVQAARSGRQNIAEGSMASATSKKTELKLTNVAKASLEELLLDFEDFLRQRKLPQWEKNSLDALAVRKRYQSFQEFVGESDLSDKSDLSDPCGIADATPEVAANTLLCLINQAIYLLKRQIEKLYRVRTQRRRRR